MGGYLTCFLLSYTLRFSFYFLCFALSFPVRCSVLFLYPVLSCPLFCPVSFPRPFLSAVLSCLFTLPFSGGLLFQPLPIKYLPTSLFHSFQDSFLSNTSFIAQSSPQCNVLSFLACSLLLCPFFSCPPFCCSSFNCPSPDVLPLTSFLDLPFLFPPFSVLPSLHVLRGISSTALFSLLVPPFLSVFVPRSFLSSKAVVLSGSFT